MRIALDPFLLRHRGRYLDLPAMVAELGYDAIELTSRPDFLPLYAHPRVGTAEIKAFRRALEQASVDVLSVMPLYRWSSLDEDERVASIRYWKRAIEVTVELGCQRMNTDFLGRPEQPRASEAQLWKSLEELLPKLESEGVILALEPHPDDFIEDGNAAVDFIRGVNSPVLTYVFCAPHVFHMGGDIRGMLRHAGDLVTQVHLADTFDHRGSGGLRYLINPQDSPVRVHQHLEIGEGEVDFEEVFEGLKEIGFSGFVTSSVLAWEEKIDEVAPRMRRKIVELLERYGFRPSPLRTTAADPTG
jgi:myo-inositol catabolism protein IolH